MTTDTGQNEREKIWAQLDAQDAGKPVTAEPATAAVETPPAEAAPKLDAKPEDAKMEPAASAADPALTVSPETQLLLDKINGLETQVQQMGGRVRNVEGRYGEINGQLKAAKETAAAGKEAPSATQIRDAQQSPEKMAALERDYPEFAGAMKAVLDEQMSGLNKQLAELREMTAKQAVGLVTADQVNALRRELTVELAHPNWTQTVKQPEFSGWMTRQPREVQLLAASDSPQDAIRMLDLYGEARKAKPNNQRRLEAAAAIPDGHSSSVRAKPIEEMTGQEYWRYLDQQDAQKAQQG